ncbi:hypothetical protein AB0M44_43755 [Streptosporangium subroseum]|uniref:hypothetical protein n=1 Tax=Streptosporangium subroseum TaxID=106412 RepID=UPI003446AB3D
MLLPAGATAPAALVTGDAVGGLYGQAPAVRAPVLEAVTGGPGRRWRRASPP